MSIPVDSSRFGRPGRRPSTSHAEIEEAGLRLFAERGFDAVSVDDIAAEIGVGRRTIFRYFPSKNDIVWGLFDAHLDEWQDWLRSATADLPLLEAIRAGVIHFNSFAPEVMASHRVRMGLIMGNPTLQAHATLRYAKWRSVVATLAADRIGCSSADFAPAVVGHIALGASLASYEQWLADPGSDLLDLLEQALGVLGESIDPGSGDHDRSTREGED
ncbi:mycofactocin system transcriptional regulator [Blastococcus sp. Marseille-P5729]|uniref:mycofactocin system transcriptional regulator n=1 Tax=Blastococcus sp. Marseille-P5729 TaxID=2086582 RepID=UPI0018FE24F9|nr:mycofactocin system transcriptional regulator [Blastococcus sp. Marseille-P5729]